MTFPYNFITITPKYEFLKGRYSFVENFVHIAPKTQSQRYNSCCMKGHSCSVQSRTNYIGTVIRKRPCRFNEELCATSRRGLWSK